MTMLQPVLRPADVKKLHRVARTLTEFVAQLGDVPAPRRGAGKRRRRKKATTAAATYAAGPTRKRRLPADEAAG